MVHLMVRCLADGEPLGMTAGGRRHDAIVARFEEFLEAHPDTPLYLTEICAGIAVSERTLRVACEEHLGMGPIRYLSLRRMHLVRRALLQADASTTTVTRIATDHGFWELGRFSVAYRNLFGEQPPATFGGRRSTPLSSSIARHALRKSRSCIADGDTSKNALKASPLPTSHSREAPGSNSVVAAELIPNRVRLARRE